MSKKYKGTFILTTLVCLLPMLAGLLLWNQLPDLMPTHWNGQGQVDDWSSKAFSVFGMPAIMLGFHGICILAIRIDPKHKNTNNKVLALVFWLCPAISLITSSITYMTALGLDPAVEILLPLTMGFLFLLIGNYLPKCKQNHTVGIRVRWTLQDEDNWNATHRFGGWVWVIGGIAIMATAFFGSILVFMILTAGIALLPLFYSYFYSRKHKKGTAA